MSFVNDHQTGTLFRGEGGWRWGRGSVLFACFRSVTSTLHWFPSFLRPINVSPIFERQARISQSARADETHRSFDHHIYPTLQNHFFSVISRWSYTSDGEKRFKQVRAATRLSDLASMSGAFSPLATL